MLWFVPPGREDFGILLELRPWLLVVMVIVIALVIALVYRWFKRRSEVMYAKGESESGGSHAKTPGN